MRSIFALTPLLLCGACKITFVDYARTGLAISPGPGTWTGPRTLAVANHTSDTLSCEITDHGGCTSTVDLRAIASLDPGEQWELEGVQCALVDIACLRTGEQAAETMAVRAWSWEILPPQDTAIPTPTPTP